MSILRSRSTVWILCTMALFTDLLSSKKEDSYQALAGRTGVGKSTIATMMGCPSKICHGSLSCTKDAYVCDKRIIDTVGLDDDGDEYFVQYNGEKIVMSGFTYPVYNFFDKLERGKITNVEFFLVYDANNLKEGNSGKLFRKFVEKDLGCSITRVLNKYREGYQPHVDLRNREGFEVIVAEDAKFADIKGPNCVFALHPDWRHKVFVEDLATVRSKISVENCNLLAERRSQFKKVMNTLPDKLDERDCSQKVQVGSTTSGGWSLGPFNKKGKTIPIYELRMNPDCDKIRTDRNAAILQENASLQKQKESFASLIADIDKGLAECMVLPTWKYPEEL